MFSPPAIFSSERYQTHLSSGLIHANATNYFGNMAAALPLQERCLLVLLLPREHIILQMFQEQETFERSLFYFFFAETAKVNNCSFSF